MICETVDKDGNSIKAVLACDFCYRTIRPVRTRDLIERDYICTSCAKDMGREDRGHVEDCEW